MMPPKSAKEGAKKTLTCEDAKHAPLASSSAVPVSLPQAQQEIPGLGLPTIGVLPTIGIQWNAAVSLPAANQSKSGSSFDDIHAQLTLISNMLDQLNLLCLNIVGNFSAGESYVISHMTDLKNKKTELENALISCDGTEAKNLQVTSQIIAEHVSTMQACIDRFEQLRLFNNNTRQNLEVMKSKCDEIKPLLAGVMQHQITLRASLEQKLQKIEENQKLIEHLWSQLNGYEKKLDEFTKLFMGYEQEIKGLKEDIKGLKDEVDALKKEVTDLRGKVTLSKKDKAKLVLRQLITQVTALMYKKLFPEYYREERSYTIKDIRDDLEEFGDKTKQIEFEELLERLKWENWMEGQIRKLKRSREGNVVAHPTLGNEENIRDNLAELKHFLLPREYRFSHQLVDMWKELTVHC